MAFKYDDIIKYQAEGIEIDRAAAVRDLEAARLAEDARETMRAADDIVRLDMKRAALTQLATQYYQGQQARQMQGNRFNLSEDELAIAHGQGGDMTKEQKEQLNYNNREKLRYMRATGAYRDDQGVVKR